MLRGYGYGSVSRVTSCDCPAATITFREKPSSQTSYSPGGTCNVSFPCTVCSQVAKLVFAPGPSLVTRTSRVPYAGPSASPGGG